jgi:hypothetical protein
MDCDPYSKPVENAKFHCYECRKEIHQRFCDRCDYDSEKIPIDSYCQRCSVYTDSYEKGSPCWSCGFLRYKKILTSFKLVIRPKKAGKRFSKKDGERYIRWLMRNNAKKV